METTNYNGFEIYKIGDRWYVDDIGSNYGYKAIYEAKRIIDAYYKDMYDSILSKI